MLFIVCLNLAEVFSAVKFFIFLRILDIRKHSLFDDLAFLFSLGLLALDDSFERIWLQRRVVKLADSTLLCRSVQISGREYQIFVVSLLCVIIFDCFFNCVDSQRFSFILFLFEDTEKFAFLLKELIYIDTIILPVVVSTVKIIGIL